MNTTQRIIAMVELLLVLPAMFFMGALFTRNLQPPQFEPARTAGRVVEWFSARPFLCLDIFLITLPLIVLVVGCVTVWRSWCRDAGLRQAAAEILVVVRKHLATLLIASATVMAGTILAIVAVHVISD